ncbi:MAG: tetratricopeptide repeat protein, partial [Xanthomonadales bacterium]|nr:tetratricopeptide repeat protein [Xanthomonadales bacterium]
MSNFRCALLLVSMAGWTATVLAHPDLIAQIQQADRQLEENPANVDVLLKRGELYRRHGDFEAAASDLVEARDLRPSHPLLNFYEGRLALDTHD